LHKEETKDSQVLEEDGKGAAKSCSQQANDAAAAVHLHHRSGADELRGIMHCGERLAEARRIQSELHIKKPLA
jgi:hypothetical protein